MIENGYIFLSRKLREHWIWGGETFSSGQAWIDIIFSANFCDQKKKNRYKNKEVIKRGSFVTSIRTLAERWHWGKDRVSAFLEKLEEDGMITVRSDARGTLITVCNYSEYQKPPKGIRTSSRYAHKDRDKDGYKDGDPPLLSNSSNSITNSNKKEPSAYNPFAAAGEINGDI
jgi:DNA-binding transcriptional MocR family regulator